MPGTKVPSKSLVLNTNPIASLQPYKMLLDIKLCVPVTLHRQLCDIMIANGAPRFQMTVPSFTALC